MQIPFLSYLTIQELITDNLPQSTMSVAFFLLGFISPFLPKVLSKIVLGLDIIFSYLYVS